MNTRTEIQKKAGNLFAKAYKLPIGDPERERVKKLHEQKVTDVYEGKTQRSADLAFIDAVEA